MVWGEVREREREREKERRKREIKNKGGKRNVEKERQADRLGKCLEFS